MSASILHVNNEYKVVLPYTGGLAFFPLEQVVYFSSNNIYCKLHLIDDTERTVLTSIKALENSICDDHLIRIHKQYIINLNKVTSYNKTNGSIIKLGDFFTSTISFSARKILGPAFSKKIMIGSGNDL